ncbi:hypothetical protein [Sphingomonas sp. 3P27F8]|uniref:hypothetical protein n=1 Tax=Sphingomonas sp. 3P27F8 TaxID=2502213 RepID=UPI001485001C|nr:hypothetical protein [Sphingomonas sp. 3P27F8]
MIDPRIDFRENAHGRHAGNNQTRRRSSCCDAAARAAQNERAEAGRHADVDESEASAGNCCKTGGQIDYEIARRGNGRWRSQSRQTRRQAKAERQDGDAESPQIEWRRPRLQGRREGWRQMGHRRDRRQPRHGRCGGNRGAPFPARLNLEESEFERRRA